MKMTKYYTTTLPDLPQIGIFEKNKWFHNH